MLGLLLLTFSLRADWRDDALRLTAGVAARRLALTRLAATPDLDASLGSALHRRGAFDRDRYLALDVIVALRLRARLDDLLARAADEPSGFFYLAINALATSADLPRLAGLYRDRLPLITTSPLARVILLDSLGRMNVRLPPSELRRLIANATPEVRDAIRAHAERFGQSAPLPRARSARPFDFFAGWGRSNGGASACAETYRTLMGTKPSFDVTVAFGYKDARPSPFVGDLYERALLVQELLAHGFARSVDDDELLTRDIVDPDGHPRLLRVRLVASALSADDRANRKDPRQRAKSRRARAAFLDAITHADVALYNGHARVGGGPDFDPPRLTSDGHIDYVWYKKNRPGMPELRAALARPGGAKLIGMFACEASQHFARDLGERAAIVSDELVYFADALRATFETIDNLAALKCGPDFRPTGTRTTRFFASGSVN